VNTNIIGRSCAAAVISLIGITGAVAPAHADDAAPSCDPAAISASIDQAKVDARVAQKAYTTHTKTSMKALVKQFKARETAEARAAAKEAKRLTRAAAKDATLRDATKAARETARAEAKEAARVQRATFATLKRQVKAERAALKITWEAAKDALEALKQQADDCAEAPEVEAPPAPA
jgi:hypothetical protein